MRSPQEVRRARTLINTARDLLLEQGKEGGAVLTFEFQAGALHALEWMLESQAGGDFADYLTTLEKMHVALVAGSLR